MNKELVSYIRKNAESPIFRDSIIKHRKILLLGKKYFYMDNKSYDIPPILYDFIKKEKLEKFNSILINVYDNRKDFIGWHMDNIKNLQEGKIISYSFAINNEDINKTLAIMEFRENNIITKIKLKHGTKIEFNAFVTFIIYLLVNISSFFLLILGNIDQGLADCFNFRIVHTKY